MKKLGAIGAAALIAMLMAVGLAPAASAYPEPICNLVVSPTVVHPGDVVTVHCSLNVANSHWVVTFAGSTRTGSGASFTARFRAPNVSQPSTLTVRAVGTAVGFRCVRSAHIRDLPRSLVSPVDVGLPNTGGPRLIVLIAGLALVLAGAVVIERSRRRRRHRS